MILRRPTAEECEQIRVWRNAPDVLPILRTKEPITVEQQAAFYRDVICNPASEHRYYALDGAIDQTALADRKPNVFKQFIGIGGLTYIKDGKTEITLVLGPAFRGKGYGSRAVDALLDEARRLGLTCVTGECYSAGNQAFWKAQLRRISAPSSGIGGDGSLRWEWRV